MTDRKKNDNLMRNIDSQFRRTYAPTYAWADIISAYSSLLGLRGFWPMSTIDSVGNAIDHSGLGKTLTYTGNPTYDLQGLVPYIQFDGVGDYLTRADEADLDILGTETFLPAARRGLTMGGWFYFDVLGALVSGMGKWGATTSYILYKQAVNKAAFSVNGGFAAASVQSLTASNWYFLVGRFDPSTETAIFINDTEKTVNLAGIPAALTNSVAPFEIGAASGASLLTGRAALCFLCASMLSDSVIYSLYHISRALFGK